MRRAARKAASWSSEGSQAPGRRHCSQTPGRERTECASWLRAVSRPSPNCRSPPCTSCSDRSSKGCRRSRPRKLARSAAPWACRTTAGASGSWCSPAACHCWRRPRRTVRCLCLIDDAHWLDVASADALLFVARRLGAEGIAILAGTRTAERSGLDGTGLPSVTLGGLDLAAAASLLEGAGLPVAAAVREQLVEQTGGNPLALLELPRGLTAGQLAGTEPLPEALPLSESVESAFLTRVLALPEAAQRLLLVAATDDSEHLPTILRAAAEFGAAERELTLIEEAALLRVVSARVEFRHPVLRSAVYGHAPSAQRRDVHRALAAHSDSDRRAWHLAAATVEPDEEVVAALEATAARAEARAGHLAAARAFERAAELSANPADRGRRLAAAARAASLCRS